MRCREPGQHPQVTGAHPRGPVGDLGALCVKGEMASPKTNWIFAGTVTWFLAVVVPVIHNGMGNLAHEINGVGLVLLRAEFQHISQPWISPFHNLPTPLLVYFWVMTILLLI